MVDREDRADVDVPFAKEEEEEEQSNTNRMESQARGSDISKKTTSGNEAVKARCA